MSRDVNIKQIRIEECTSGKEFHQYCQANKIPDEPKVGSFFNVRKNGVEIHYPDSDRVLPPETRQSIIGAFLKAGLVAATLLGMLAWLVL